jgi:AraC family transcriptional regulator of adaptative response/methylated-DNA-[protein]-cysteine methyltransferase
MRNGSLPKPNEMARALMERDAAYEGVFFAAVRTTGIFCRPTCPAKKPKPDNVEFFGSAQEALLAGYRACLRCRPLEPRGATPDWLRPLLEDVQADSSRRWRDEDLRARGLDPARVRRWFKEQHGMTFQAYDRARRLGLALGKIRNGADASTPAYEHGFESLSGFRDAFRRIVGETPARSRDARQVIFTRILIPLGLMLAGATDDAVVILEFMDRRMLQTQLRAVCRRLGGAVTPGTNAVLDQLERELNAYFEGELRDFTVPLASMGTPFQQAVWDALRRIPYGETRSYEAQARSIGQPESVRAVARANGDNRIAIVIPCHRVIGKNGKLVGYGGGLWRKQFLLDLELTHAGVVLIQELGI